MWHLFFGFLIGGWVVSAYYEFGPGKKIILDEYHKQVAARELGEPCEGCGKRSRITTAACDHCDYEDK